MEGPNLARIELDLAEKLYPQRAGSDEEPPAGCGVLLLILVLAYVFRGRIDDAWTLLYESGTLAVLGGLIALIAVSLGFRWIVGNAPKQMGYLEMIAAGLAAGYISWQLNFTDLSLKLGIEHFLGFLGAAFLFRDGLFRVNPPPKKEVESVPTKTGEQDAAGQPATRSESK